MFFVTLRHEFDAAHRLLGYDGPCANLHGHRYVAEITVKGEELDDLGILVDFKKLKSTIGARIDDFWDHKTILNFVDPLYLQLGATEVLGTNGNPTAERMAKSLFNICHICFELNVHKVRLYETPDCYVEYME